MRNVSLEAAVAKVSLPQADSLFSFEGETLLFRNANHGLTVVGQAIAL